MPKKKHHQKNIELPLPKKVGIVHSHIRREDFPTEAQYITEKDAQENAVVIAGYLAGMGIEAMLFPGDASLAENLRREQPELVINLVDSVKGQEDLAATIPGVLELLEIPYTGANVLGLALDTNKYLVKELLQRNGLPVPNFQLFSSGEDYLNPTLRFPLISKLNSIHGSVEITREAVSENEKQLRKRLRKLIRTYQQPVLVEEFVGRREITAILLNGRSKKVYLAEKVFREQQAPYWFLTFEDQWLTEQGAAFEYHPFKDSTLREMVRKAFDVAMMKDYGKFDIRMDEAGRYYFIDSNCNPAFGPKELDMALSVILDMNGVPFQDILRRLITNTLSGQAK
jgi:D-alanine-D-alanine ligase